MKVPVNLTAGCPWCGVPLGLELTLTVTHYNQGGVGPTTMATVKGPTEHHECIGPVAAPAEASLV